MLEILTKNCTILASTSFNLTDLFSPSASDGIGSIQWVRRAQPGEQGFDIADNGTAVPGTQFVLENYVVRNPDRLSLNDSRKLALLERIEQMIVIDSLPEASKEVAYSLLASGSDNGAKALQDALATRAGFAAHFIEASQKTAETGSSIAALHRRIEFLCDLPVGAFDVLSDGRGPLRDLYENAVKSFTAALQAHEEGKTKPAQAQTQEGKRKASGSASPALG